MLLLYMDVDGCGGVCVWVWSWQLSTSLLAAVLITDDPGSQEAYWTAINQSTYISMPVASMITVPAGDSHSRATLTFATPSPG